jgi:hypothetical protein
MGKGSLNNECVDHAGPANEDMRREDSKSTTKYDNDAVLTGEAANCTHNKKERF